MLGRHRVREFVSHFKHVPVFLSLYRVGGLTPAYSPLDSFYTTILHALTTVRPEISLTTPPLHVLFLISVFPFQLRHTLLYFRRALSTQKDVKQEKIANGKKKTQPFNYEDERINISAVKLLSVFTIKKCFCIIGDFLHPSECGAETFEVNSELLQLSVRTN